MHDDLAKRLAGLSPEKLALLMQQLNKDKKADPVARIAPQPRHPGAIPLSFSQQRLWFLDQFEPGNPAYNLLSAIRLLGTLNIAALRQSIAAIIGRHEALRTTFAQGANDDQPTQVIAPELEVPLTLVDLHTLPHAEREAEVQRLATAEARQPFDLQRGPLLRTTLLRLGPQEHVLLLTLHHIISDGWSGGIFIREVSAFYTAFVTGKTAALPPLAIQYADFAQWQRQRLAPGGVIEEQLSYWKQQLSDHPPVLDLPTDRPRPVVQRFQGARHAFVIDKSLTQSLRSLAQQEKTTLFAVLLSVFKTLLYRYTGQLDLLVGTPVANRNRAEIEGLIGFFVNTLVLRTDFSGDPTFHELLRRVHKVVVDAQAHQDLPFDKLIESLNVERDLSRPALFQVLFVLQTTPMRGFELPGLALQPLLVHTGSAKFDIELNLEEMPDELLGLFEYNTDLFEATTIARMCDHFLHLLAAIVAEPSGRIAATPLLTAAEERQMLVEWNATARPYPQDACLHTLIEAQVARTPDAIAVSFEDTSLTYGELNVRANQLAHHLWALGVRPETRVALCMERSLELIVGLLGVLKAGGAYVPIDPAYPAERVQFMLDDADATVLLTQQQLADRLPQHRARVVSIDTAWSDLAAQPIGDPSFVMTATNAAYMMYTSGSTGQPKGAINTHQAIVNRLLWMQEEYSLTAGDRVLQKTPFSFDVSVWEFFWPLSVGATLVVARPGGHQDSAYLVDLIADAGITTLHFVPSMLQVFLDEPGLERCHTLRRVICSGEALPLALQQRFFERVPRAELHNLYGPTEAAVDVTYWPCRPDSALHTVPIGRPVANTQIYLLDARLNPVPVGVPGELYIGGIQLARGYLNRPGLSAERFIPDRFSATGHPCPEGTRGARLYKTGDLARYLPDGAIEYLGRLDFQVKVRGFRIELGEIEAILGQHPQVREAIVMARQDEPGNTRLVAYVVENKEQRTNGQTNKRANEPGNREEQGLNAQELRGFLREHLPDYMVPSACVFLDALPLSPNGKLDRKALPAPDLAHSEHIAAFSAPRAPTEELIAGIWAAVLGVERVGINDNFFALGGHSLLATQVMSRVRSAFRVELPLSVLFNAPTVAALSARVDQAMRDPQRLTTPPIVPVAHDQPQPLSFAQQRLWFLDQLQPGGVAYNIPAAVRMVGPLQIAALQHSLQTIVARHQALRTTFETVNDEPMQVIAPTLELPLPIIDLSEHRADQQERLVAEQITVEARTPFDLRRGPLIRTALLRLHHAGAMPGAMPGGHPAWAPGTRQEHVLLITVHHIVADGWSVGVFLTELGTLYNALSLDTTSEATHLLPDLPIQYADYAVWQRQWLAGSRSALEQQLGYWKQQLGGTIPTLELPTDRPRPAVQTFQGARHYLTIPQGLTQALIQLSRREAATLFMTLLAAFQTLLHAYTHQDDLVIGTPVAGRTQSETEHLIGLFINTLVLRTNLGGNPSFRELLRRVRSVALDAYAHQDVPFEQLVEALQSERSLSRSALFQVLFILQNTPLPTPALRDLSLSQIAVDTGTAKFDLACELTETSAGLAGVIEYNTELFDASTIARLSRHFQHVLAAVVAQPDQPIGDIALLDDAERRQILVEWNRTTAAYDLDRCVHELVEAQVARAPDNLALISGETQLSYAELNQRANQLAHRLLALGLGPEQRVGLCLERSPELLISLLAVLKAAGCYVPLDPAYPADRLAYIVDDAQIQLLLTSASLQAQLPATQARVLVIDTEWPLIAQQPSDNLLIAVDPDQLAYLMYTSGSTGRPKGVQVSHRAIGNRLLWSQEMYPLHAADRVLQIASFSFDISLWELVGPLLAGAQVVMARPGGQQDSSYLVQFMAAQQITVAHFVPSLLQIILDEPDLTHCRVLRGIFCGGEALPNDLPDRVFARLPVDLIQFYGPTEAAINATYWIFAPGMAQQGVPIGRPIANTQIYLLDRHGQPVPIGVPGELHIGGVGLARGYNRSPDQTAERFIPHPFSGCPQGEAGARLYKTGDLARYRSDGVLEFLGRIDQQVKIRGFRIEPDEIESVLRQHPQVREAIVMARQDSPPLNGSPDTRLVAYIVTNDHQSAAGAVELRAFLKERLPEYMLPASFVMLDALPLTPNGKVDRKALPAPDTARPELADVFVAPRTPLEAVIAKMWIKVLGVERVGIHDNFFLLGGHSLLAIKLASQIGKTFQTELPVRELFEHSTVAGLAELLIAKEKQPGQTEKIAQLIQRIKTDSPENLRKALEQKRKDRNNA